MPAQQGSRGSALQQQVDELERCAQLQAFPAAAGRRHDHRRGGRRPHPRASPARDRRAVLRSARLHELCRDRRAGGGDGPPQRLSRGARPADSCRRGHPRAVHRRRHDGLLQRPDPVPDPAARAVRLARRHARSRSRAGQNWSSGAIRSASASASPRATRPRADRLRGPFRLRGDRHGDEPRGAALRRGAGRPDPRHAAGRRGGRGLRPRRADRRPKPEGHQPPRCRRQHPRVQGGHNRRHRSPPAFASPCLRGAGFDRPIETSGAKRG